MLLQGNQRMAEDQSKTQLLAGVVGKRKSWGKKKPVDNDWLCSVKGRPLANFAFI
jgi:hypothetical protein